MPVVTIRNPRNPLKTNMLVMLGKYRFGGDLPRKENEAEFTRAKPGRMKEPVNVKIFIIYCILRYRLYSSDVTIFLPYFKRHIYSN